MRPAVDLGGPAIVIGPNPHPGDKKSNPAVI